MKRLRILTLCTILSVPSLALAQTAQEERDRGFLVGLIEDNLSGVSRTVTIQGFAGALSSRATIEMLTVADQDGIWFRAEGLAFEWNRSSVLRGNIDIQEMSAVSITVLRSPISEAQPPDPEASPFSLPELPVSVEIDQIRADTITLGAPLLGEELVLDLDGSVSLISGQGTAQIVANRLNGDGRFEIFGSYDNNTRELELGLDLSEDEGGLVVRALDLSGQPSVDLSIDGAGPIDDFSADLTLATAGVPRIGGTFGLLQRSDADGRNRLDVALDVSGDLGAMLPPDYSEFFGDDVTLGLRVERGEDGAVSLRQLNIDAEALTLQGTADLTPEGWPLRLDVTGRIAARDGSPVLLPLSGPRTFVRSTDLSVTFDAEADDRWDGRFDLREFTRPGITLPELVLAGDGRIVPASDTDTGLFTADLSYSVPDLQLDDAALAQALGPAIDGDITLSRASDGPFRIIALTMEAAGLTVDAEGTLQTSDEGLEIQSSAKVEAATLQRFAGISGLADLGGSAGFTVAAQVQPLSGGFDVSLSGQTGGLRLGIAPLDPLLAGSGQIDLSADRDETGTRLSGLTISTPQATVVAQATLTSGESNALFDINVRDMSQSLPGLSGAGRINGTAQINDMGDITLDVAANLPGTTAQIAAEIPASDDGSPTVQADIRASVADLAPYSVLAGRDLTGGADLDVSGSIKTDLSVFDVMIDATGTDLGFDIDRVDPLLAGVTLVDGRVQRTDPLNIRFDRVSLRTDAFQADISGDITDGVGKADFGLALSDIALVEPRLRGGARLTGSVTRDAAGTLVLDALGTGPGGAVASIEGRQDTDADGANFSGAVIAAMADLSPYSALAGRQLSGSADAAISGNAAGDLRTYDLAFDLMGRDLDVAGVALSGGITATGTALQTETGPASVTLNATGPGGTDVRANADVLPVGDAFQITTDLAISADSIAPYSGLAGRSLSGGIGLNIEGSLQSDLSAFDLAIAANTQNINVGIPAVTTLLRGAGSLSTRASRDAGTSVNIDDLRISYPNLSAEADLQGRDGGGTGTFQVRLADIGLFTPDFSGPITANGQATRSPNGVWSTTTTATGPDGIRADLSGTIAETGALNIQVNGVAPLGLANTYIEPRRLGGQAQFDLAVNGPPALNSISGTVRLNEARLTAPTLGRALDFRTGTIALNNGRANLDILGVFERGGSLQISGPVGLSGGLDADLSIVAANVTERDPNLYDTKLDGRLSITGPLTGGARIAGTIDLGDTEIRVPSSDLSSLGDLPQVAHLGATAAVQQTLGRAGLTTSGADTDSGDGGSSGPSYPLDITVNAPARMFVRGRGLDAELGGSLTLSGSTRQVIPAGQFNLIRGRLDILQQRFALDEGSITLQGNFIPFIRLVATTTASDGTAISIVIEGPASEPVVSFESTPDLPQDEVLARLIFNQPISDITPFQAVQLAAAVSTLAGRGGGGLIDDFRNDIGLDDLDITTDDDGAVAVRAGKYLTENVYTDVTIGAERTEIELNLDLTDSLTITGRANSDGETGLGIFFERDY